MPTPPPFFRTKLGKIHCADSALLMPQILDPESVDLVITSPPFGLVRKKDYGNEDADRYVAWFEKFGAEFSRVIKPSGSLVIDIGGAWKKGMPTRSLYHYELLIMLCRKFKFHLAQEFFWWNPAKLPTPAEWVTVRRVRVKDAVNCIWWLSKTPTPKASNRRVLQPYSDSMKVLLGRGYKPMLRPSGPTLQSGSVPITEPPYRRNSSPSLAPKATRLTSASTKKRASQPTRRDSSGTTWPTPVKPIHSRTTNLGQRCKTLERLAAKVLEPLGLRHQRTRLRTGGASGAAVDAFFKSNQLRFQTSHVRCKDSDQLSLDDAMAEVGIGQRFGNRVAVVISTGKVSEAAREYARCVNGNSPFSVILLGKTDLATIRRRKNAVSRLIADQAPVALVATGPHQT